jgi:hypothetical protein
MRRRTRNTGIDVDTPLIRLTYVGAIAKKSTMFIHCKQYLAVSMNGFIFFVPGGKPNSSGSAVWTVTALVT